MSIHKAIERQAHFRSYEQIVTSDTAPAPAHLLQGPQPDIGTEPVKASRYFSREFFEKECQFLWPRVWQVACREEEVANPGDYIVYENVGKSFIVVRSDEHTIKAFYNSCLHRGRKLVTAGGSGAQFRCPFHGISWHCDGRFKENPLGWDFPQWNERDLSLPQVRVECWGGWVFINQDANAKPLLQWLSPIPEHFRNYNWQNRYKAFHVVKKLRCNWKAAAEAFMESHHVIETHPQLMPSMGDINSQYDILSDYVTRQFSASCTQSPHMLNRMSESDVINYMIGGKSAGNGPGSGLTDLPPQQLPEGVTARNFAARAARADLAKMTGQDLSGAGDTEILDDLLYNVFPHMSFWAGYGTRLTYRWRPNGLDPDSCLFELMFVADCPTGEPRPTPAVTIHLDFDDPFSKLPDFGDALSLVFDQDMANLPHVQDGLKASATGVVHFARYLEQRLRHNHQMIDRFISAGEMNKPG